MLSTAIQTYLESERSTKTLESSTLRTAMQYTCQQFFPVSSW